MVERRAGNDGKSHTERPCQQAKCFKRPGLHRKDKRKTLSVKSGEWNQIRALGRLIGVWWRMSWIRMWDREAVTVLKRVMGNLREMVLGWRQADASKDGREGGM